MTAPLSARLIRVRDAIAEAWAAVLGEERARAAAADVVAGLHARCLGGQRVGAALLDAMDAALFPLAVDVRIETALRGWAMLSIAALYIDEALLWERCAPHAALARETHRIETAITWLRDRVAEHEVPT